MLNNDLIDTLTIEQLLKRPGWEGFSAQNILEMADKGAFGLYVKPWRPKRSTWFCVSDDVQLLIDKAEAFINVDLEDCITHADQNHRLVYPERFPMSKTDEREYFQNLRNFCEERQKNMFAEKGCYEELQAMLIFFQKNNHFLLEKKPGFERLATHVETQICLSSQTGAIKGLKDDGRIFFSEANNVFGFFEKDGRIFSNSYFLLYKNNHFPAPKNYKGFYTTDDLFVFIDQIVKFELEKNISIKNTKKDSVKRKQKRVHALHELIKEIYNKSSDKSPRAIWNQLKEMCNEREILQEVDSWTKPDATIFWITHRGKEDEMIRSTFENYISRLNNPKSIK